MKTLEQLKEEKLISIRLYRALIRGIAYYSDLSSYGWYASNPLRKEEITQLTIKDILELFDESTISKWRGIGEKSLNELKGLI